MDFDARELNFVGHLSRSSKMPERYGRIACAAEWILRNTIVQKVVDGWALAPSFHIHETVPNDSRIGKAAEGAPGAGSLPASFPGSLD